MCARRICAMEDGAAQMSLNIVFGCIVANLVEKILLGGAGRLHLW